jgi:hypothetical protein
MTGGQPSPRRSHRSGEGPDRPRSRRRKIKTMSIKLTDTQLLTLSAAVPTAAARSLKGPRRETNRSLTWPFATIAGPVQKGLAFRCASSIGVIVRRGANLMRA